jgi:hypothetical protein
VPKDRIPSHVQFDRHGQRTWREAEALLDTERTRHAIGQVSVPSMFVGDTGTACVFDMKDLSDTDPVAA